MLWLLQGHQPVHTNSCPHFNTSTGSSLNSAQLNRFLLVMEPENSSPISQKPSMSNTIYYCLWKPKHTILSLFTIGIY
jgi:hypothetical protein